MTSIARAIGFRFFERSSRGFELRLSWVEVTGKVGLAFALCMFEEHFSLHIHLGWPNIFIRLPFLRRWHRDPREMMESWGFLFFEKAIHLHWGSRCKVVHLPWAWEWQRWSILMADGRSWVHEMQGYNVRHGKVPVELPIRPKSWFRFHDLPRWEWTSPYRYVLRSGEVQERTATISITEGEWRWRALQWLPWPRKIRRSIDVKFDNEVGERSGSWKGGVLGCSYHLLPGEMAEECLRRMERERKF